MANEIDTRQLCLHCINAQSETPETLQSGNEDSTGKAEHNTAKEQFVDDHCCDCKISETKKIEEPYYGQKVFIGNLRHDVEKELVIRKLQELLSTVGICISEEDFSMLIRGPRKSKFLFAKLKNIDQVECVISHFDGLQDEEIVAEKRALKICLKKDRPTRRGRKRKRKISQGMYKNENESNTEGIGNDWDICDDVTDSETTIEDTSESQMRLEDDVTIEQARDDNFIRGSFEGHGWKDSHFEMKTNDISKDDLKMSFERGHKRTDRKLITGKPKLVSGDKTTNFQMQVSKHKELACSISMPNLNMSDNANRESSITKVYVMGQVLPNEDRRIEYKMHHGKCLRRHVINHVRRYSCAFLNSEGR